MVSELTETFVIALADKNENSSHSGTVFHFNGASFLEKFVSHTVHVIVGCNYWP
jgi:hypothetical protein